MRVGGELAHASVKLGAVIYAATKHNLTVHIYPAVIKHFQVRKHLARVFVAEHFNAQFGICRMHGDIHRRHFHIYYTTYVPLSEVRKRDIVALQKGKAGVVVLEIYALSHSAGVLVDKAEDAVVCAPALFVHKISRKVQTDIVIFAFSYADGKFLPVPRKTERQTFFAHIKAIVQNVRYFLSADADEKVARFYTCLFGRRAFFNARYLNHKNTSIKQFRQV